MPTNHLYPGLPHAPASANLPRKPYSQSASLEKPTGHGSTSTNTNNDLRLNSFAEKPGQFSTARPTTPVFPQLSSTTQDILARVQGGRSTLATSGPPKGLLRDTKSVTGLLKFSASPGSGNTASPSPSTSKNPATGSILSVVQHTSNPNARQTTGGGSITNSNQYRETFNHPAKAQTLTSFRVTSQIPVGPQPDSMESTIQVGSAHPQAPVVPASTSTNPAPSPLLSSSRRQRSYVLSDGTVVSSGKGLGRGRPGIKRGPRKPKLDQTSSTASTTNTPAPSPLPGKKRKHSTPKEDEERVKTPASSDDDDDDDGDDDEEEDSDNYPPKATHPRSGRSTQNPQSFVSADSPAAKKPRLATEPPNPQIKNSLIKKKIYRGREQNALCEYCLRGRGPANNAIVFCDGCNLCWHQNCHDPRIPKELVLDKTAEWFCKDCVVKLKSTATEAEDTNTQQIDEATVRAVPNAAKVMAKQPVLPSNTTVTNAAAPSGLPGRSLDLHKRQQYFSSLSKQALIDLLLQVYSLAPELPIFHAAGQINAPAPPPQTVPPSAPYAPPAKANPAPTLTPTITPTPPPTVTARPTTTATPSPMKPPPLPLPSLNTSPNPNLNPSRAAKAAAPKYTSPSSPSSESTEDSESEEEYQEE